MPQPCVCELRASRKQVTAEQFKRALYLVKRPQPDLAGRGRSESNLRVQGHALAVELSRIDLDHAIAG